MKITKIISITLLSSAISASLAFAESAPNFIKNAKEAANRGASTEEETTPDADQPKVHPEVYIDGKLVLTKEQLERKRLENSSYNFEEAKAKLEILNREDILPFVHNPYLGPKNAKTTIVELSDLSCLRCMPLVSMAQDVQQKFKDNVRLVHIHLPEDPYNTSNPAAFYGKIAQDNNLFWEYQKSLSHLKQYNQKDFVEKLVELGISPAKIREQARDNARKYYRELDADTNLTKNLGEITPPVLFVNGIRVRSTITKQELEGFVEHEIKISESN